MSSSDDASPTTISVLFVCLGNICRSPLAEGIMLRLLENEGLSDRVRVDSAGTGEYHAGDSPDPRSVDVARRNDIRLRGEARQVRASDLENFDYVVAMDRSNLANLEAIAAPDGEGGSLHLLREFDPQGAPDTDLEVPDPYYGGADGFDRVYEMIERSCRELLGTIVHEHGGA